MPQCKNRPSGGLDVMKAPPFSYERATSVANAIELLARHGPDAQILAGGQSLMPMLNFRVARPAVLIDINPIADLAAIRVDRKGVFIGALVRHADIEHSGEIAEQLPLIAAAMPQIAHPAIRNRGTFGGSCALADPAAELPACCVALGAEFRIAGPKGERSVPADKFFAGVYTTAIEPGELLLGAQFPPRQAGYVSRFLELARRHGDYAMVGAAAHGKLEKGRLSDLRFVYFAVGDRPTPAVALARAVEGKPLEAATIDAAVAALKDDLDPPGDLHASSALKRHLAGVIARRLLNDYAQHKGA
jgi:aerobic carbon-monoxide dehydrogenase medium subunit